LHLAGLRQASQVVTQQIDDHDVFCPLLGRRQQSHPIHLIFERCPAARCRSFHRPGHDPLADTLEKQLRRKGKDGFLAAAEKASIANRLTFAQARIERQRVSVKRESQRKSEVDLVAIAVANPATNLTDLRSVLLGINRRRQVGHPGCLLVLGQGSQLLDKESVDPRRIEHASVGEQPDAQHRPAAGRGRNRRLEACAQRVVGRQSDPLTKRERRFNRAERGPRIGASINSKGVLQTRQQNGAAGIAVKQRERRASKHQSAHRPCAQRARSWAG
jgi:hypothetical protein